MLLLLIMLMPGWKAIRVRSLVDTLTLLFCDARQPMLCKGASCSAWLQHSAAIVLPARCHQLSCDPTSGGQRHDGFLASHLPVHPQHRVIVILPAAQHVC